MELLRRTFLETEDRQDGEVINETTQRYLVSDLHLRKKVITNFLK